ncbi:HEPN domain-containing protein [Halarcobacter sp.]|uniref:HEPN domain-containing protein n=1 Tax=Halarcobacter sp. TaxID=2321133 RepID=UPI003AFFAB91
MQKFNEEIAISFDIDKENCIPNEPLFFGTLKTKNDNLIIEYQENKFPDYQNVNREQFSLYGQTISGKKFIATDCFFQKIGGPRIIENGLILNNNSIFVNRLFIGDWDSDIILKKIKTIKVRFSYLEHWLHHLKVRSKFNENKICEMSIENLDLEFEEFVINNEFKFNIETSFKTEVEANKKFIFDSKKWIILSFDNYVSINEVYQKIFILNNFFRVILPTKKIFVEDLLIKTENDKTYEILYKQTNYQNEDLNTSHTNFLYLYNEDNIEGILSNWFSMQKKYGMIIDSLFSIFDDKSFVYSENRFIAYMQWIEGFTRVAYPTNEDEKLEFENKIHKIIKQISSSEDKEFISNITKYKFETPLREQLKKIIYEYGIKNLLNLNSKEIKSLINKLLKYRNKLTHISNKQEYDINELVYLNMMLKNILYIIFHKKLLLDKDNNAYEKVVRNLIHYYKEYRLISNK